MSTSVILSICSLLLLAYIFDITASRTRIPSVILLLISGWTVKLITEWFHIEIPDISKVLPALGVIGLILIVLEGSMELELNKGKRTVVLKSLTLALISILIFSFGLAYFIHQYYHTFTLKEVLGNVIPLAVISSAIAIPTVAGMSKKMKELVIYESSASDIIGVIFFNFIILNDVFINKTFINFGIDLLLMFLITFIGIIILSLLLSYIKHHVKFMPIIILVILIYFISKQFHFPSLIFILLLGLFLGNVEQIKKYKYVQFINPEILQKEVVKFRELIVESAFLIRSLFFLVFGYLIETKELLNYDTMIWSSGIVLFILFIRCVHLLILRLPIFPLLFIAPRGLITILLFLSIPISQQIPLIDNSLIIQVIVLSAIVMMFGMMISKKNV